MTVGDIFKLTLVGSFASTTELLAVFYYRENENLTGYNPTATLNSFDLNIFPTTGTKLMDNITTAVNYSLLKWEPVTDETQLVGQVSINHTGLGSGDSLPPFCAYGFRYYPTVLHRRSGYKRFAGVSENVQSGGVLTTSIDAWGDAVSVALGLTLLDGDTNAVYEPVILSRVLNGEPRVPPVATFINEIAMQRNVSTQNTRKP